MTAEEARELTARHVHGTSLAIPQCITYAIRRAAQCGEISCAVMYPSTSVEAISQVILGLRDGGFGVELLSHAPKKTLLDERICFSITEAGLEKAHEHELLLAYSRLGVGHPVVAEEVARGGRVTNDMGKVADMTRELERDGSLKHHSVSKWANSEALIRISWSDVPFKKKWWHL